MVHQAMGFVDLMAGLWILLLNYSYGSNKIGVLFAGYLIIKGLVFRGSFMSYVDIAVAVYLLFGMLVGFNTVLAWVCAAYLVQKGIISFF
ncbi:hypothetical protein KY325_00920 [Candidatus Woesearchaeota archaeon]|nr:hypothetical protein [Candidatus Woesearchaeota archaeon]MBW3017701.1 hypothetical protein [Candidatus Woesearchaeota archaeon]